MLSPRLDAPRRLRRAIPFACSLAACLPALRAGIVGPAEPGCPDHALPSARSRPIDPLDGNAPPEVRRFREQSGSWLIYWDDTLATPRYIVPARAPRLLVPGPDGLDPATSERAVRAFLERHREFFGVEERELAAPEARRTGRGLLLSFDQQTASGLPVRGANVRALLSASGRLVSLKSYLARDISRLYDARGIPASALLPWEEMPAGAPDSEAGASSRRLEVIFSDRSLDRPVPAWRILREHPSAPAVEELRDARDGRLIARCERYKSFDYSVNVAGIASPLDDRFSPPDRPTSGELQGIEGVVLTDGSGRLLAHTNRTGHARFSSDRSPLTIVASLAHNPRFEGEPGRANALHSSDFFIVPRILTSDGRLRRLDASEDFNGDGIPDLVTTTDPGMLAALTFERGGDELAELELSFWLQLHTNVLDTLRTARRGLDRLRAPDAEPVRLPPLRVDAVGLRVPVETIYNPHFGIPFLRIALVDSCDDVAFPMVPTLISHEVGHHLIFSLTGINRNTDVEEGAADAIAGFTHDERRIGFTGETSRGPIGFLLGETTPCVPPVRAAVAGGFWRLWQEVRRLEELPGDLARGEPLVLELFYRWLETNRTPDREALTFDDPSCLLDELLSVNLLLEVPLAEAVIRAAFDTPLFHQATRFVRGDVTQDRILNITDPICTLGRLFGGQCEAPDCADAMDADDNGRVELTDAIYILQFLFLGGPPPEAPFPLCGVDPTLDEICCFETSELGCRRTGDP